MARRTRGRIPTAGCNQAGNATRLPFLLSPRGLRVFLAWPALLGRDSRPKGDSLPKVVRRAMQGIRNTAAGIAAALTPWPSQKSAATLRFVILSQVLSLYRAGV